MRLLDAEALIYESIAELVEFTDETRAPPYAILSHTWENEEVLFEDIALGPQHEIHVARASLGALNGTKLRKNEYGEYIETSMSSLGSISTDRESVSSSEISDDVWQSTLRSPHVKAGWNKVMNTCLQTVRDGMRYLWIDTCCIDKSSSAELSEAINSMFRWYAKSAKCYAYLSDLHWSAALCEIPSTPLLRSRSSFGYPNVRFPNREEELVWVSAIHKNLRNCHWFSRGWTLQELIAPRQVWFFNRHWQLIAEKNHIVDVLASITGIHAGALRSSSKLLPSAMGNIGSQTPYTFRTPLSDYSVAQRMSWASSRTTTRPEDEAYSLLGIFEINMPLLYGEGRRAFQRLQEEIIKGSTDQSIMAWEWMTDIPDGTDYDILAPSTANFGGRASFIESHYPKTRLQTLRLTAEGLKVDLRVGELFSRHQSNLFVARLNCGFREPNSEFHPIGMWLRKIDPLRYGFEVRSNRRVVAHISPSSNWEADNLFLVKERLVFLSVNEEFYSMEKLLITSPIRGHDPFARGHDPELVTIKLDLSHVSSNSDTKDWTTIAAYPRYFWYQPTNKFKLPFCSNVTGAIALANQSLGLEIVIVFLVKYGPRGDRNMERLDGPCQFWMIEGLPQWLENRQIHGMSFYFKDLCKRASMFAAKDRFEHSTRRWNSHKSIALSTGEVLRASLRERRDPTRPLLYLNHRDLTFHMYLEAVAGNSRHSPAELGFFI